MSSSSFSLLLVTTIDCCAVAESRQRMAKARQHTEAQKQVLVRKQIERMGGDPSAYFPAGGGSGSGAGQLDPKHVERWLVLLAVASRMQHFQSKLKARATYLALNFRRERVFSAAFSSAFIFFLLTRALVLCGRLRG
jgi:hypothetical protein